MGINNMKLNNSFIFKDLKKELINHFGLNKADFIWKNAELELSKLEKEYLDLNKKEAIFPAVAVYRVIEKEDSDKAALEFIRYYGDKVGIKVGNILGKVSRIPKVSDLIWNKMDIIGKKMSDGYKYKELLITKHSLRMDVIECPLYEGAKKLGTSKAAQLFCCMDKIYMNGIRGVQYQRTKSIAEGDDCCDYRLEDNRELI